MLCTYLRYVDHLNHFGRRAVVTNYLPESKKPPAGPCDYLGVDVPRLHHGAHPEVKYRVWRAPGCHATLQRPASSRGGAAWPPRPTLLGFAAACAAVVNVLSRQAGGQGVRQAGQGVARLPRQFPGKRTWSSGFYSTRGRSLRDGLDEIPPPPRWGTTKTAKHGLTGCLVTAASRVEARGGQLAPHRPDGMFTPAARER